MSNPVRDHQVGPSLALLRLIRAAEVFSQEGGLDLPQALSELEAAVAFAKQDVRVQNIAVQEVLEYFHKKEMVPASQPPEMQAMIKTVQKAFPKIPLHLAVSRAISEAGLFIRLYGAAKQRRKGHLTNGGFELVVEEVSQAHAYVLASTSSIQAPPEEGKDRGTVG